MKEAEGWQKERQRDANKLLVGYANRGYWVQVQQASQLIPRDLLPAAALVGGMGYYSRIPRGTFCPFCQERLHSHPLQRASSSWCYLHKALHYNKEAAKAPGSTWVDVCMVIGLVVFYRLWTELMLCFIWAGKTRGSVCVLSTPVERLRHRATVFVFPLLPGYTFLRVFS